MRMNRPRTPPAALPALTGAAVAASSWRWAAAEPEPSGRLLLPSAARRCLGADSSEAGSVSGVARGDTLVLRPGAGNGRSMTVDGRGRSPCRSGCAATPASSSAPTLRSTTRPW